MKKNMGWVSIVALLGACSTDQSRGSDVGHLVEREGRLVATVEAIRECESLSAQIAATCDPEDSVRTCEWNRFAETCGRYDAEAIAAGLRCILAASTDGSCRTFSDPSLAADCLDAALGTYVSPAEEALATRIAEVAGESDVTRLLTRSTIPLAALLPDSTAELQLCVDGTEDVDGLYECVGPYFDRIRECEPD